MRASQGTPPRIVETRRLEAGYNLVVLMVAITVLNILVAAMLPLWSTQIRREKEEELVFRGFQYAEAIRVFHQRFQRYPNRLEELIEVKPRSIRQLWKDPMSDDGKWSLIFQNEPEGPLRRQQGQQTDQNGDQPKDDDNGRSQLTPAKGETVEIGPIVGVRSKSGKKSILVLFGRERYDEWAFTENLLAGGGNPTTGIGPTGAGLVRSTRWLGRPMRFQPPAPQEGTLPDGRRPKQPKVNSRQPGSKP